MCHLQKNGTGDHYVQQIKMNTMVCVLSGGHERKRYEGRVIVSVRHQGGEIGIDNERIITKVHFIYD